MTYPLFFRLYQVFVVYSKVLMSCLNLVDGPPSLFCICCSLTLFVTRSFTDLTEMLVWFEQITHGVPL